jgi:hypothetical protein
MLLQMQQLQQQKLLQLGQKQEEMQTMSLV